MFEIYKAKAGIIEPGTVYTLRHCFATHVLEAGGDALYLKRLMGHACFASADRYLHIVETGIHHTQSPLDNMNL